MSIEKGYYDFAEFLSKHFQGKVQKISINAGFTCPNRDGSKGKGGCTYCNNQTFNPDYCRPVMSVSEQLEQGKQFFARKYPQMKYLAYFQAYTNTYGELQKLKALYEEALAVDDVVGLVIGTRPDCMPDELLEYLEELSKKVFVLVEYGVETSKNATLEIINRGHTWEDAVDAVNRTKAHNILCGIHLIIGLPGETIDDILATADAVSTLPLDTVKLHQLQLIRGTRMAQQVEVGELAIMQWSAEEYIDVCLAFLRRLSPEIAVERFVSQSPAELLISPKWGLKNYEFTNLLMNRIRITSTRQGSEYAGK
ncbi:MAG: TIGR01212 family radical SAM protein [Muribaculaceae bacterium]|nr:TIGR01212 family radical SAM protein [Muribaculaceae bacterium]